MTTQSKQITVRGTRVNSRLIEAYAKRVNSLGEVITIWGNAATLQITQHGNRNWLDDLFALPIMRKANGDLSKMGEQTLRYIAAHCPRVVYDAESQKLGLKKFNPNSPLADHFVAPGATEADEAAGVVMIKGKAYTPHGDFLLTFDQFNQLVKPVTEKDEDELPSVSAKACAKALDKALTAHGNNRFIGTEEELLAAMTRAKALYLALDAAHSAAEQAKLEDAQKQVDVAKAAELLASGQAGKGKRAGGKVDKASDKAAA